MQHVCRDSHPFMKVDLIIKQERAKVGQKDGGC